MGSNSASCRAASSLAFFEFGTGGRSGIGFPFAFARATFFWYRSSSAVSGGGDNGETEAENTDPSSGEIHRSIFWWKPSLNVSRVVTEDEPSGRRMRMSFEEVVPAVADWVEAGMGGDQEDNECFRAVGSYEMVTSGLTGEPAGATSWYDRETEFW